MSYSLAVPDQEITYTIADLAEAVAVSRRTVRFYVQRGLLTPPDGGGRGSYYTAAHLETLLRIKTWQLAGRSLEEIEALLGSAVEPDTPAVSQSSETWRRLRLADGVELNVRLDRWAAAQSWIARLLNFFPGDPS